MTPLGDADGGGATQRLGPLFLALLCTVATQAPRFVHGLALGVLVFVLSMLVAAWWEHLWWLAVLCNVAGTVLFGIDWNAGLPAARQTLGLALFNSLAGCGLAFWGTRLLATQSKGGQSA